MVEKVFFSWNFMDIHFSGEMRFTLVQVME